MHDPKKAYHNKYWCYRNMNMTWDGLVRSTIDCHAILEVSKHRLQSLCQARVLKVLVRHHDGFGVLELPIAPKLQTTSQCLDAGCILEVVFTRLQPWQTCMLFMNLYDPCLIPRRSPPTKITMRFLPSRCCNGPMLFHQAAGCGCTASCGTAPMRTSFSRAMGLGTGSMVPPAMEFQ